MLALRSCSLHLCVSLALVPRWFAVTGSASSGPWSGQASSRQFPCTDDCAMISKQTLESHGPGGETPPYVSIFGHALDVSGGERHYAAGGGYSFLAGRDATRAYALGTTKKGARTEDVSDLDGDKLKAALSWLKDLASKYRFVGVVAGGHFYDASGKPTPAMRRYIEKLQAQRAEDKEKEVWSREFPRCNVGRDGAFWCGVQGGSPMWFLQPGREEKFRRCACVKQPVSKPITAPTFQTFPMCWQDGDRYKCKLQRSGEL